MAMFNKSVKNLPSRQTIRGLNGLIFFVSDVRHGIGPLLSIYLKGFLGWDSATIGIALSMIDVTGALSEIPCGMVIDASKHKRSIVAISCLLIIFSCFIILKFPFFSAILFAQSIMGIVTAFISPAISAITLGLFGKARFPKRITKNEIWNHAGNVITALTAGVAGYFLGYSWVFYVVIFFAFISIASIFFIKSYEIDHAVARELIIEPGRTNSEVDPIAIGCLLKRKSVVIFGLSLILYYMGNAAQIALVGQLLVQKNPKGEFLFISGSMIVAELVMVATAFAISFFINRIGRKPFFLTAFMIVSLRALLFAFADKSYAFLLIQILDGMAAGIIGVMLVVITSDIALGTGRFNFLLGVFSVSISIGAATSNVLAGYIVKYFGYGSGFLFLSTLALIGAIFFHFFMPETDTPSRHKQCI
jgi:MFS family permease